MSFSVLPGYGTASAGLPAAGWRRIGRMHYDQFRREYTAGGLTREMLDADPLRQFEHWLEQAVKAGLEDPTAMVLATVDAQGDPWQRIVLLKGLSDGGFVFYTNFNSAKGLEPISLPA